MCDLLLQTLLQNFISNVWESYVGHSHGFYFKMTKEDMWYYFHWKMYFLVLKKVYFFGLFNVLNYLCNRLYWLLLQEDIALQRNVQLISDFLPSLDKLEAFEANVTNRKSYVSIVKNVTRGLMEIQKNMTFIAEVICHFFFISNHVRLFEILDRGLFKALSSILTLHKICENTGFYWSVFSRIKKISTILSLYGRIRVSENPYSRNILCSVRYSVFQK